MKIQRTMSRLATSLLTGLAVMAATMLATTAETYYRRVTCGWEMDCYVCTYFLAMEDRVCTGSAWACTNGDRGNTSWCN